MAGERLTIEGLRNFYIKHRLEHLPSGGNYMTVIQQDEIIDVHTLVGQEFDKVIVDLRAEAWDEGAAYVNQPFGIEPGMRNPYREALTSAQFTRASGTSEEQ